MVEPAADHREIFSPLHSGGILFPRRNRRWSYYSNPLAAPGCRRRPAELSGCPAAEAAEAAIPPALPVLARFPAPHRCRLNPAVVQFLVSMPSQALPVRMRELPF